MSGRFEDPDFVDAFNLFPMHKWAERRLRIKALRRGCLIGDVLLYHQGVDLYWWNAKVCSFVVTVEEDY